MAAKKPRTEIVVAPAPQLPGMTVANVRMELDRTTDPGQAEAIHAKADEIAAKAERVCAESSWDKGGEWARMFALHRAAFDSVRQ